MKMINIILSNGKKVLGMEEENCIIQLEKLNMKVILLKANMMVMEKTFLKMVNIIMVNLIMVYFMEKGVFIMKMEILSMKVIGLIINQKEMEKAFLKMMNVILANRKKKFQVWKRKILL